MLEISCFSREYAKIVAVTNIGGTTGDFLCNLRKKGAFVRLLECGQTYLGLEWERIPAFIAHCEKNGIIANRKK